MATKTYAGSCRCGNAGGAFASVQLTRLDEVDDGALAAVPVSDANGRDENGWNGPCETEKRVL